jgi:hypothetical protein
MYIYINICIYFVTWNTCTCMCVCVCVCLCVCVCGTFLSYLTVGLTGGIIVDGILTYVDVFWRLWRILTYPDICWILTNDDVYLTYVDVCWRMLTYELTSICTGDISTRILTYSSVDWPRLTSTCSVSRLTSICTGNISTRILTYPDDCLEVWLTCFDFLYVLMFDNVMMLSILCKKG